MRPLQSDQILILLQAIAIAWPVSVLALSAHTPQPTPPVDDDDDDEQRPGGGSGGGNIDPDHDDSGPDEDDEEDDDEGDTLWTRVKARLPGRRPWRHFSAIITDLRRSASNFTVARRRQ